MKTMHDLLAYLRQLHIPTKSYEHEAVHNAAEGLHLVEKIPGVHCKNLFLIDDQMNFWLVAIPFTTRVDLKKLAHVLQRKKFQFGSPQDLQECLGITLGSVTPLGIINDEAKKVRIILDNSLLLHPWVNIHPLINTQTLSISPSDLMMFIKSLEHTGFIVDFTTMEIIRPI